ncbi:MAG TPA: HD domain-containing phosphohydrolase [bacterium]|nr:HD domain-containing phosphohydrolase [bacterium]
MGRKDLFAEDRIALLKEIGSLFRERRGEIVENWVREQTDRDSPKFAPLKKGIEMLVDAFIEHISRGDLEAYFNANSVIGKKTAAADVRPNVFFDAFHDFEDAYAGVLWGRYSNDILKPICLLDQLHHKTIAILAKEYAATKDATIFAMAKLAESRDPETGAHLERTREYSRVIGECLGHDADFVENIYAVSVLHDIGKVGIPDSVLLKPGGLTNDEFEIMRTHAKKGGDTLNAVVGDLEITRGELVMARDIAYFHHEKYDGTGYNGLAGEDIPVAARIFAAADIYDALRSKRPYKGPLTHEQSARIILEGDGRTMPAHFDPSVLEAFAQSLQVFLEVSQKYGDMTP